MIYIYIYIDTLTKNVIMYRRGGEIVVRVTYGCKTRDTGKWTYSSKLFGDRDTTSVEIGHDVAQMMSMGAIKVTVKKEIVR